MTDFGNLKYWLVFMRYKRSGSALLANMLDAHRDIIFPVDRRLAGAYKTYEKSEDIWERVRERAARFQEKPYTDNGYSYPIEGVGHSEAPRIIGHKSTTKDNLLLTEESLADIREAVGLPLKFIHLVRDPYDQVNARWQQKEFRRAEAPLDALIHEVSVITAQHDKMKQWAGASYGQFHYEDIKFNTVSTMAAVCRFLGVAVYSEHLLRCKELVFETPEKEATTWTYETREKVRLLCEKHPDFYGRYA